MGWAKGEVGKEWRSRGVGGGSRAKGCPKPSSRAPTHLVPWGCQIQAYGRPLGQVGCHLAGI